VPLKSRAMDIVMCSGTKTSSPTRVLLPVPRIPTVCQVSSSVSSDTGTVPITAPTTSPWSPVTVAAIDAHVAW